MGKPYSMDLRQRAVAAVLKEGLSRHEFGGALRGRAEHGDQLGATVWGDGERRAAPFKRRRDLQQEVTPKPGESELSHGV